MSNANILTAVNPVQPPRKRAYKIDDSTYIKRGTSQQIRREVQAIDFVRKHTSIPVPSVIEMHIIENDTSPSSWFSMAMVPGCPLTEAWPNMDVEARQTTQMNLCSYLYEIQAVPPPTPAYIGSCNGGPAYDHRLNNGYPCGPFASESDFNDFLVGPVARCPRQDLVDYYRQQLADNHSIVFTHADLCGDHIIVDPINGKVTGIIDWEMAGWWPAYWEYTKSRFGNRCQTWWKTLINHTLNPYLRELQIEEDLQQF